MKNILRPGLFLDRDGVINVDRGYVHRKEEFEFIDGIFELVASGNQAGYVVVVVTNQAGIGRGYYSKQDFYTLTEWMQQQFILRGAKIDAVYFCPYHPIHGVGEFRRDSEFRKPGPGMIIQAANELCIDLTSSMILGDSITDIQAGLNAGIGTLFYLGDDLNFPIQEKVNRILSPLEVINYL